MKVATAFVEVRPDTRNFGRDLDKEVTEHAKKSSISLGKVLGAGAFLAGANKAIDASSRLEQAVGGTAAVFGEASKKVEEFSKGAAESAGLSERAARELTSALGGLLKGFGFTGDEAAELSVKLAGLGADLAATFGGTPEEAVQALGAALRGETDPLERFGIALNQTLVNQKAVELGLAATTGAVDQHAKAQATLALIYERSADAAGQFARESDTAAGQAAISAAKTENAAADLGEALLPIYSRLAQTVGSVAGVFGSLPEPVQTAGIALGAIVALAPTVKAGIEAMSGAIGLARRGLSASFDAAAVGAYNFVGSLGKVAIGAGALGGAMYAASVVLGNYQKAKADAARIEQSYTDILSEQTDEVEANTRAFAGSELLKGELGEAVRNAGGDIDVLTDAIVNGTGALEEIDLADLVSGAKSLDEALADVDPGPLRDELIRLAESGELTDTQLGQLVARLQQQTQGYKDGTREAENKAAADEAAGKAAGDAAPKIDTNTGSIEDQTTALDLAKQALDRWKTGMDAAFAPLDLEEAVDRRAKAFSDLAADIRARADKLAEAKRRLGELQALPVDERPADFARQVREAQEDVQAAIEDTSLSLEGNSEAALRNRDDLRETVGAIADVIQLHRDEGASLEELQTIRDIEKQGLIDQLTQLGYNKTEIDRYVTAIEAIPISKATTLTVDTAEAEANIARLLGVLTLLPGSIDAAQAEKFLNRQAQAAAAPHALGGTVRDGLFTVGEYGTPELMYKQGSRVDVIAGGQPTPVSGSDDSIGLDQLLELREQNRLLRAIANQQPLSDVGTGLRRQAVEVL